MTCTSCTCIRTADLQAVIVNDPHCPAPVHATRATHQTRDQEDQAT